MESSVIRSKTAQDRGDDLSFVEFLHVIKTRWRLIATTTGAALAAAVGFLLVTPAQYEAIGLVDIPDGVEAITPQKTIERIEFPSFKQGVLRRLAWDATEDRAKAFLASPPSLLKRGTDFVQLRVRGATPSDALAGLQAIVGLLSEVHQDLAEATLRSFESNLKVIRDEEKEIRRLVKEYDRLASLQSRLEPRDRFSESLLYLQMVTTKRDRLADLARSENELTDKIRNIRENPVRLVTEPAVSAQPVYPSASLIVALAMLGGAIIGLLGVFIYQDTGCERESIHVRRYPRGDSGSLHRP